MTPIAVILCQLCMVVAIITAILAARRPVKVEVTMPAQRGGSDVSGGHRFYDIPMRRSIAVKILAGLKSAGYYPVWIKSVDGRLLVLVRNGGMA